MLGGHVAGGVASQTMADWWSPSMKSYPWSAGRLLWVSPGRAIDRWSSSGWTPCRRDPSALDAPPFLSSQTDPSAFVQDAFVVQAWPMEVVVVRILVCYSGS